MTSQPSPSDRPEHSWLTLRITELEGKIQHWRSVVAITERSNPYHALYALRLHEVELEYKERTGRDYEGGKK